jgi:hypothetical protein
MSKVSLIKTSFNGGELSPRLDGRVDIDKYSNGCSVLENFIPLVQGGIMKRPGTQFISSTKGDQKVWLAKFEFTYQQSFILEFGHEYIRFYFNHGQIVSGSTPYEIATPYTSSDLTTAENTFALSMAQTGDVIYIANRNHPPAKLSRLSNTNWTYSVVNFKEGPFEDNNTNKFLKVIVHGLQLFIGGPFIEYAVTLDSTGALFTSSMVGTLLQLEVTDDKTKPWYSQISPTTTAVTNLNDLCRNDRKYYGCNVSQGAKKTWYVAPTHTDGGRFDGDEISWWYLSDEIGVVRIDSVLSATNATGTVLKQVAYTAVPAETWAWSKAAWRSDIGYPDQVTFFRERLVFARDQKVWFSTSGDYENFAAKEFGEVLTDSAISIDITSEDSSPIKYLVSTPQGLICGTNSDQVLVAAASIAEPFGPTNIIVSPGSGVGGRQISPVKVDQSILVIHRSGKKLFNTQYDANSNFFISPDQTVISDHILSPGIIDMAWQRDPWNILWMVRNDGQLIGFTFNQQQQVQGFHRHITNGVVEAIQVIPSPDGSRDDLWIVVRRSINSSTVRYVELLKTEDQIGFGQSDFWYSDSALQYTGASTTIISGLNHLIGQSVQILANGASHPNVIVSSSGSITLNYPVTSAVIGLPYIALVQTMNLEGGANNGTSQGKVKRIDRIIVRLLDSLGNIQCAPSINGNQLGKFDTITFHNTNDRLDLPPPIFTGDTIVNLSSEYNRVGRICIKQTEGFPLTILAIMPDVNTYER